VTDDTHPGAARDPQVARPRLSATLHHRAPPGAAPGTLVADPHAAPTRIGFHAYDAARFEEHAPCELERVEALWEDFAVKWLDVQGLADLDLLRGLGEDFGLHRLALEDVVNVHQRAKVEAFDDHVYIVCRMPPRPGVAGTEQVSIFLGADYVLTFQERPGDCFDPVRQRLRAGRGRIRTEGADYLAYALIDATIDAYFPVMEELGERMEALEEQVTRAPDAGHVAAIHELRRDLLMLRRALWPMREALSQLVRDEVPPFSAQTRVYLRDCHDHVVQLIDMAEILREVASSLMDIHLSSVSMRMNETMKVLTVIATIFIPLGFIAGIYGMNFDPAASSWNMPELGWRYGYPFALGLMLAVAAGLLGWFWRRGWIGSRPRRGSD